MRVQSAKALVKDIKGLLAVNPAADYIAVGDFNSNYNESAVMEPSHNNTGGITGINQVLNAQGDEMKCAADRSGSVHYDLHFELKREARRSAYHNGFGWSSLDHMIIGGNLYDSRGITYVDNSFQIVRQDMPRTKMLFTRDGRTNRWQEKRRGSYTEHFVGGYSDHLPLMARFQVRDTQTADRIRMYRPGTPD